MYKPGQLLVCVVHAWYDINGNKDEKAPKYNQEVIYEGTQCSEGGLHLIGYTRVTHGTRESYAPLGFRTPDEISSLRTVSSQIKIVHEVKERLAEPAYA